MWMSEKKDQPSLRNYVPHSDQGHAIFTTRDRKTAVVLADPNRWMKQLSAGRELLRMRLINKALMANAQEISDLLSKLTYLPLAIVQAAAYINTNSITLLQYLTILHDQEQQIDLLSETFEGRRRPVATTWLVSFKKIRSRDPPAAKYLYFMAYAESKGGPLTLLPPDDSNKRQTDAIGLLDAYAFVTRRDGDQLLDLHRLVHLATRNWLRQKSGLPSCVNKATK
ncbi:MAG: hypothetical protein M1820_002302 [Bogoriella megaspora]|nr:MAG: hypothetical protein M1820_002302 [Bogoriella megaspora]